MVDLVLFQSLSYVAAAISVVLYILNLFIASRREERNKRITMSSNIIQALASKESERNFADLLNMQWEDMADFRKKYDSSVNPENFATRFSYWFKLENLGYLLKEGLVERELIYNAGAFTSSWIWVKFRPMIEEYRRIAYGGDAFKNLEYLAREMWEMKRERDPAFLTDQTYFRSEDFEKAFA